MPLPVDAPAPALYETIQCAPCMEPFGAPLDPMVLAVEAARRAQARAIGYYAPEPVAVPPVAAPAPPVAVRHRVEVCRTDGLTEVCDARVRTVRSRP